MDLYSWLFLWPLILVNVVALACGVLVQRGRRWAWVGLAMCFYVVHINQGWLALPSTVYQWAHGDAGLHACGLPVSFVHDLDRETRLPWGYTCLCDPDEAAVNNTALRLLHRYVGPAHGTWQGHIPDLAEAQALLAAQGREQTLQLRAERFRVYCMWGWTLDGVVYAVPYTGDLPLDRSACEANHPQIRVVRLDEGAALVGYQGTIAVWLPDRDRPPRPESGRTTTLGWRIQ